MDVALDALWKRVLEEWEDDSRHGKFLSYATENGLLGEAAGLYRTVSQDGSPYRLNLQQVEDAKKRLLGVALLAQVHFLEKPATDPGKKGKVIVTLVAGLVFIATMASLWWVLQLGKG